MSDAIELAIARATYAKLRSHLVPRRARSEEAAFVFARRDGVRLVAHDFVLVPPEGFVRRSLFALELSDATRASVIKKAHDLGACLVEFHSHPTQVQAEFSPSDRLGLREFAPHVLWRLKDRPFGAVVMGARSFDSLCWTETGRKPAALALRLDDGDLLEPTRRTLDDWREEHDE